MDQETKKCSKNFPKPFQDHTTLAEDSYAVLRRRDTGRLFEVNGKDIDNRWIVEVFIIPRGFLEDSSGFLTIPEDSQD